MSDSRKKFHTDKSQTVSERDARRATLPSSEEVAKETSRVKRFFKILGPGLITGASDDDPSGIGTYSITGASLGFSTLWTAIVMLPLMASVQYICAKVGLVTKMGLAEIIKKHYSRWVLYPVLIGLVIANTINAGVDIGAIAAAINLLAPIPVTVLIIPIALCILVLQIWGSYNLISTIFKWLSLSLLAYIGSALFARPDIGEVLRGTFLPTITLNKEYLTTLVALLGTTISPYLFFWQASQEVEEKKNSSGAKNWRSHGASKRELKYTAIDVNTGMVFSQVVMYFIILATAATLHKAGQTNIGSAHEAALALRPLAGPAAEYLLAMGLIGAGFLAVPVLTGSSGYALAAAFGWKRGLNEKPHRAKEFYVVIAASTLIGMIVNFLHINPIQALFWTAVINGVLAPPLLVIIMLISGNRNVMGSDTNTRWLSIIGWATAIIMILAAIGLFIAL